MESTWAPVSTLPICQQPSRYGTLRMGREPPAPSRGRDRSCFDVWLLARMASCWRQDIFGAMGRVSRYHRRPEILAHLESCYGAWTRGASKRTYHPISGG